MIPHVSRGDRAPNPGHTSGLHLETQHPGGESGEGRGKTFAKVTTPSSPPRRKSEPAAALLNSATSQELGRNPSGNLPAFFEPLQATRADRIGSPMFGQSSGLGRPTLALRTVDPRAAIIPAMTLAVLRRFGRGERRGPEGAIGFVQKRKGGSSRIWWEEVVRAD